MKNKNFSFIKYILFNLLKPFLTISLVLTGVVWLSRSLKYIDLIINKGLSLSSYFWFVSLIAPKILALLLPLISFATIVYTYQKLKADSELIVMESCGISKFTLMIPALIFGVIASVILLFIEAYISPNNYKTFKAFQSDLRNNFVISSLQEGSFHNPISGLTVFIDKIAKDGTVNNILIHDTRSKKIESTILAKKGIFSNIDNKPNIIVFNGSRYVYNKLEKKTSILNFAKYEFQIDIAEKKNRIRFKQVEERTLAELFNPDENLSNKIKNEFYSEGHRRLSSPFLVIFMCSLASFSVLFGEMKRKLLIKNIVICSFISILIQGLYISIINNLQITMFTLLIPYFSMLLLSLLPLMLIKYEDKVLIIINKLKYEIKL